MVTNVINAKRKTQVQCAKKNKKAIISNANENQVDKPVIQVYLENGR